MTATALRTIPIGSRFLFRNKFDHGFVRGQVGVKIGETTDRASLTGLCFSRDI